VLMREHASRRLQATQKRSTELNDKRPILPFNLPTPIQYLGRYWILVYKLGSAAVTSAGGDYVPSRQLN